MRDSLVKTLLVVVVVQVGLTACQPGNNNADGGNTTDGGNTAANGNQIQTLAAGNTTFVCGTDEGVPATIAQTPQGNQPVIRWQSDFFNKWGWTPQRRCEEVSQKFQTYKQSGELGNLKLGKNDGHPVACVSEGQDGNCSEFLFTFEPDDNPDTVLNNLTDPNTPTIDR